MTEQNETAQDAKRPLDRLVMPAVVCVNSWGGRQEHPCRVIAETPKRYRITVDVPTALPPGFTLLMPGETKLVPKHAIRFVEA